MFIVTEADAAAIRAVFDQEGELSAAIELRRRFTRRRVCPEHRRVVAAASSAAPSDAAASPQGQLARPLVRARAIGKSIQPGGAPAIRLSESCV